MTERKHTAFRGRGSAAALFIFLIPACYMSTPPKGYHEDAASDTRIDDGPIDLVDFDTSPEGYRFIDRDSPDKNITTQLMFAAVPSIAFNGSTVGLVYRGMQSVSGERIGFIPLDAYGNKTGDERIIVDGEWLYGSIPRISASGDGSFLFCTLLESPHDHIVILELSPEGEILSQGEAGVTDIFNPISPPLKIESSVFVAAESYSYDRDQAVIYRFTYPDLAYAASSHVGIPEISYDDPQIVKSPGAQNVLLFYSNLDLNLGIEEFNSNLDSLGQVDIIDLEWPVMNHGPASNSRNWFVFASNLDVEGALLRISTNCSNGNCNFSFGTGGDFYGSDLSADASDFPSWGAALSIYFNEEWNVWVDVNAVADTAHYGANMAVSDTVEPRAVDDIPWCDIAWTENGFLVVWDQWRIDTTYSLFSSFIAFEPVY